MTRRFWTSVAFMAVTFIVSEWLSSSAFGQSPEPSPITPEVTDNQPALASADAATKWIVDRDLALEQQLNSLRQEFGAFRETLAKPKFPTIEEIGRASCRERV